MLVLERVGAIHESLYLGRLEKVESSRGEVNEKVMSVYPAASGILRCNEEAPLGERDNPVAGLEKLGRCDGLGWHEHAAVLCGGARRVSEGGKGRKKGQVRGK